MEQRYAPTLIAIHWLTAALLIVNLALGLSMVPLPLSPRKLQWYAWHKWIGITIWLMTALRVAWRSLRPAPVMLPMPLWQQRTARTTHVLLYVLLLAIPISGWIYSSASGVQVVYLGLLPLPDLVPKDRTLAAVLRGTHLALNVSLASLVALHAGAALKHHFIDRDRVLSRMVPFLRTGE